MNEFSYGIANRGSSVRIPRVTGMKGYGYYEDRRPSSDIDPYLVTAALFDSALFGGSERLDAMLEFIKENTPYLLLTEEKLKHWTKFRQECI